MTETPPEIVDTRLIIVCKPGVRGVVNGVLNFVDPANVGDIMSVPLRRAGDADQTPDAFWSSWAMPSTRRGALLDQLLSVSFLGLDVFTAGEVPPTWSSKSFWLFDGGNGQWTGEDVLTVLGLETIPVTDY